MRITKSMIVALTGLILTPAGLGPRPLGPQATAADPPPTGAAEAAPAEAGPGIKDRPQRDEALNAALDRGLKWLAAQQKDDGHWSLDGLAPFDTNHVAATALGLLPFLRAGEVPWSQKPRPHDTKYVEKGIKYLLHQQREDGSFGGELLYAHALATMAVCEAYSPKSDLIPAKSVQRAVDYTVKGQTAQGGWSYRPNLERPDTSNTGWQIQALRSAERAGARVPKETWTKVSRYLDSVATPSGRYGYIGPQPGSTAMTASALLGRRYLGWDLDHPDFVKGIAVLQEQPAASQEGCYYAYYAAQVMATLGADTWLWNRKLRRHLLKAQEFDGGWPKARDRWGQAGGRHLVTSLSLLALEARTAYVPLPEPPAELTAPKIESLWTDLAEDDVPRAARAMRLLAALPQQTVPLLHKRLQPVPATDAARITRLIADLDSDAFAVRERAAAELEKLGELAAPALEQVLEAKVSLEVRKRVERLLARLDEQDMSPDRLQAIRAVKVLEYMGTSEARRVLQGLAAGAPGALPTEEAKAALQRLAKRSATKP
jgi:hypothetical protein